MVLGFTWLGSRVRGFWPMSLGSWQGNECFQVKGFWA